MSNIARQPRAALCATTTRLAAWPRLLQVLSPTRLGLDVQSTRVANSSFSPFLDGISVPVEQLVEAVRGAGATRVMYDVTFVDDTLRVTRCDDQLLLHRRV